MIKLYIKPGVRVRGISPEILLAIEISKTAYEAWSEESMVITSITDGDHKAGSLHHTGEAIDLRLPKAVLGTVLVKDLREQLGDSYDVILEKDHIHIEYDPY